MKKTIWISLLILIGINFMFAAGEPAKTEPKTTAPAKELMIDNFDDANIEAGPTWWTFGALDLSYPEAKDQKYGYYSLKIKGKADSYYVGGMGTYVGKDASDLDHISMQVCGAGSNSGTIKVQLYDDDNNTYQLEQDSKFEPLNDDRVEYELPVTWTGWRTIEIPVNKFVDTNPAVGDDKWNPDQKNGSGGVLHFQYVCLSNTEKGEIDIIVDNIKFIKKAQ